MGEVLLYRDGDWQATGRHRETYLLLQPLVKLPAGHVLRSEAEERQAYATLVAHLTGVGPEDGALPPAVGEATGEAVIPPVFKTRPEIEGRRPRGDFRRL